jgi:hypothetical protein
MGYSASTPMKSAKARDEMLAFLAEHYRPWHVIQPPKDVLADFDFGWVPEEWDWTTEIVAGDGIDYNGSKTKIGFNFGNSSGLLGHYGFSLLRWVALKAGKRRKVSKKEFGDLGGVVPVFQYDCDPAWPVLVRSEWEDKAPEGCWWCLTDDHGFKPVRRTWLHPDCRNSYDAEVLTRLVVTEATQEQVAVLKEFLRVRIGMAEEEIEEEFRTEPDSFAGDLTSLSWVRDQMDDQGIRYTAETGPLVLYGYRKEMAEKTEPAAQAAEAVIQAELRRLSELWEAR